MRDANVRKGVRLTAQAPMIVCAHHHIRKGQAPIPPDARLGHAANFLWMLKGERPSLESARLMDTAMAWLQQHGPRTLWVGVWSENLGAQRFYARYGFEKVGTYGFPVGRVVDLEFILRRDPQR